MVSITMVDHVLLNGTTIFDQLFYFLLIFNNLILERYDNQGCILLRGQQSVLFCKNPTNIKEIINN